MMKKNILIIVYLLLSFLIFSNEKIRFDKITTLNGLSQNDVLAIFEDSEGYIWFGTHDGLNRYNGDKFKVYKYNENDVTSISGNVIQTIFEDREGELWIGTEGAGLNKYDRKKDQFIRFYPNRGNKSVNHSIIKSIIQDNEGNIWIGTYGGGIDVYNKESKKFKYYKHINNDENYLSSDIINILFKDSDGNIWIGTENGGLNKYDDKKDQFIRFEHSDKILNSIKQSKKLSGNTVNTIFEDGKKNLWIGTWGGGLNKYNKKTKTFFNYRTENSEIKSNIIRSIDGDKEGNLWIGTWDAGVIKYDIKDNKFNSFQEDPDDEESIESNIIWSVYVDKFDIVWLGTWGNGINRYVWEDNIFKHYKHGNSKKGTISNNKVNCFFEDSKGNIWIGTLGGGLNKYDRKTGAIITFKNNVDDENSLPNNIVRTIYQDSKGRLWIGTDKGLSLYLEKENKFKTYTHNPLNKNSLSDDRIYSICEDSKENLWVGTWGKGLNRFDTKKDEIKRYNMKNSNLSSNNAWIIFEDSKENLWVGTTYGLNLLDKKTDTFKQFLYDPRKEGTISSNTISNIYEDKIGRLWIGTYGGGLNLLDKVKGKFKNFNEKDGLISKNISDIEEDDFGNLWLSTSNGIMSFNPENMQIKSYNIKDGLQGKGFVIGAGLKSKTGEIYFGGGNGFNVFYPKDIRKNRIKPPVVLTSLTHDGEKLNLKEKSDGKKELTLSWKNNSFEFEFIGLNYIQNSENEYAYILEGFDKKWNKIGQKRYGKYTNIPDGSYILKLKSSNNDGVWNDKGLEIEVNIIPPFWRKVWFKILMAVIIVIFAYIVYEIKLITIKKRNRELTALVKIRTKKLEKKNNELVKIQKKLETKHEQLEKALNEVKKLSRTDTLTKLPNRRYILEKISGEIERYKRNNKKFSIIMTDIDFFKKFNDKYGHDVGDLVLKRVADTLKETKRETDFLARWGGEEFLIILPETTINQALISAERFRKKIMEMKCETKNEILQVRMTFGISEYDPTLKIDKNIDKADQALYEGKKERNCCICYTKENKE